jgi:hypothetical protein
MKARFASKCLDGKHAIAVGDEIVPGRVGWIHPGCAKASPGAMLARDLRHAPEPETEWARDARLYREAKAALSPARRERWAVIEAAHENFDGEDGIALGTLRCWLVGGDAAGRMEASAKRSYAMDMGYAR